jgi:hypothetical protein
MDSDLELDSPARRGAGSATNCLDECVHKVCLYGNTCMIIYFSGLRVECWPSSMLFFALQGCASLGDMSVNVFLFRVLVQNWVTACLKSTRYDVGVFNAPFSVSEWCFPLSHPLKVPWTSCSHGCIMQG